MLDTSGAGAGTAITLTAIDAVASCVPWAPEQVRVNE